MRTMKLLTKALCKTIPPLYSQEGNEDQSVVAKFFTPDANYTWYVIEGSAQTFDGEVDGVPLADYDPGLHDVRFFGYVDGQFGELGYFMLSELRQIRGRFGLPVERDTCWTPTPLADVRK